MQLDDYDTSSNMQHHRLIEAFRAMSNKERMAALLPDKLKANPALARALVAENRLVTGIGDSTYERAKASLLTDEDMEVLTQVEASERQIRAAEKAYQTSTEVLAELDRNEPNLMEAAAYEQASEPETPSEDLPLHKGGMWKFKQKETADAEA